MWPYRRKHKDTAILKTLQEEWIVGHGTIDDKKTIVHRNKAAESWIKHPDLKIKLGFATLVNNPIPGQWPSKEETQRLYDIEDRIVEIVKSRCTCIQVLVITNFEMREVVFYISPGPDMEELHHYVQEECPTHEVHCVGEFEPGWEAYKWICMLEESGSMTS